MRVFFTYLLFVFVASSAIGQQLLVEISPDNILIGEPIKVKYTIKTDAKDSIDFFPSSDIIKARKLSSGGSLTEDATDFEVLLPFKDTIIKKGSTKKWIGEYVLTAWDEGTFILPGPSIIIADSTCYFDDAAVDVQLIAKKDSVDLYEIREKFADIPNKPFSEVLIEFLQENWWWMTIIAVAAILFWLIWRRKRWDKEEDEKEEIRPLSLKERTILAIEALEKEELWEKDRLKEHFVELSYILRSYLTARYGISLLDKTTHQTKLLLTKQGLHEETVDTIARILSQSDMVKFAQSKPDVIAILRQSTLAKQIIAETSPLDFDNVD